VAIETLPFFEYVGFDFLSECELVTTPSVANTLSLLTRLATN